MASKLFDLTGKVALVTGSSKGIGKAIAEEMARHGAQVVISSRKADVCQQVADDLNAELKGEPGGAVAIPAHVGQREELERLVAETRERLGPVDSLVCNAAVNPYYGPMSELPDSALDKILGINIKSNHWLAQLVLPEMIERKDGAIIIVSSVGGRAGLTPRVPGTSIATVGTSYIRSQISAHFRYVLQAFVSTAIEGLGIRPIGCSPPRTWRA